MFLINPLSTPDDAWFLEMHDQFVHFRLSAKMIILEPYDDTKKSWGVSIFYTKIVPKKDIPSKFGTSCGGFCDVLQLLPGGVWWILPTDFEWNVCININKIRFPFNPRADFLDHCPVFLVFWMFFLQKLYFIWVHLYTKSARLTSYHISHIVFAPFRCNGHLIWPKHLRTCNLYVTFDACIAEVPLNVASQKPTNTY